MAKPKIIEGKIADLIPDDRNANLGTERGRYMIERSLTKLGAGRSIVVDKNGKIIAGNKTTETAVESGFEDTIIVQTDGTKLVVVQRTDLDLDTDAKAKELAIADNRTSEVSYNPDPEILLEIGQEIDLSDYYTQSEMDKLLEGMNQDNGDLFGGDPPDDNKDIDEGELAKTKHTCPNCNFKW
jgi:hypothetical protein